MGAASCFGSSSTVVIWVLLLFTQAYTVQASIWWRRRWISNTKLQKLFNSATCLDFSLHQDFLLFYLTDYVQPGKYHYFEISISIRDIPCRITLPHTIFKKKSTRSHLKYLLLFSIKLSSTVLKWICLCFVSRISYITLKKM